MKIGFVGIGKLGKDVAEVLDEQHDVVGYDIRPIEDTTIKMTSDLKECVRDKDIVFIAVPTQHHEDYDGRFPTSHLPPKDFDYSIAVSVIAEVDKFVNENTLIVMISTMLPGTVRREIAPRIKNGRFIYNPYLIAQGTVKWDMKNPEMIMLGTKDGSKTGDVEMLTEFYMSIMEKKNVRIAIGTWEEVEAMKIFYNTFITTKLCLVNMIQDAAMAVGNMNVDVVTDALKNSTDRIMGPKYMTAGLGDGGGCHPRDNIALRSFAKEHRFGYDLFDSIIVAREQQANNIAKYINSLRYRARETAEGRATRNWINHAVILGAGFKPGVDQHEGSPSILVGYYLEQLGFSISYDSEPIPEKHKYGPLVYLLGWPKHFDDYEFMKGSIVLDPWRSCPKRDDVEVHHYGNTRNLKYDGINVNSNVLNLN
jgi:UDPglucose 6-dehydrogenase